MAELEMAGTEREAWQAGARLCSGAGTVCVGWAGATIYPRAIRGLAGPRPCVCAGEPPGVLGRAARENEGKVPL